MKSSQACIFWPCIDCKSFWLLIVFILIQHTEIKVGKEAHPNLTHSHSVWVKEGTAVALCDRANNYSFLFIYQKC